MAWKRRRLAEIGREGPAWLHFVPLDFESGESWWDGLLAALAPGSTVAMTYFVPMDLVDEADRPGLEMSAKGAAASGTPFISFYDPEEINIMAIEAGFAHAQHIASATLAERYFTGRTDGLRPSTGEDFLLATTA